MPWREITFSGSNPYTCGYCGNVVTSLAGYFENGGFRRKIYICPRCEGPTTFVGEDLEPGVVTGSEVLNYPEDLARLYKEARSCMAAAANTGAVLCARKLLMNIAVSKGAEKGNRFTSYIDFLTDGGHVPPESRDLVKRIRDKGHEAPHEIMETSRADAADLINFSEMLLRSTFDTK